MDSKGYIFIPGLVIGTLIIFGYALLLFATENKDLPTKVIGSMQSDSLKLISDAEKELLDLDNIARYAAYNALVKLGDSNTAWDTNLFANIERDFNILYEKEMNEYLGKTIFRNIEFTYIYDFDNKLIIEGLAKKDFVDEKDFVKYSIRPNFKIIVDYDLKVYDRLYKRYSEWGKDKKCVQNSDVFEEMSVICGEEGEFLNFEVVTNDLGYVQPKIKFKIRKTGELFST